jgi:hypothetical protein
MPKILTSFKMVQKPEGRKKTTRKLKQDYIGHL